FELFDTGSEILVNELAPRVHNSGHYSQNALSESQFTLHVKAVCGIECDSPTLLAPGFAMANLIGTSTQKANWKTDFTSHLHWYGKSENRPGRKMGHLNAIAVTGKKALAQVLKDRKKISL
ncbi:MAG: ATP-grasp domain-containing protein, partial [Pseudobdellovibrionaceae bacterium]